MTHLVFMRRPRLVISLISSLFLLSACQDKPPAHANVPAEVSVITITQTAYPVVTELPGRLEAQSTAEVRARVPGIILKRYFTEGSLVKEGDLLYQIDPTLFQANLNSANASLERSLASAQAMQHKATRYQALIASHAVSQQEYDDAVASDKQAQADIAVARAAVAKAQLDLDYARVTAPITGRIGRALVTTGSLVGQGSATPLALIQATEPMYVLFKQPATEVARIKQEIAQGRLKNVSNPQAVTLILDNGQPYSKKGKLLFTDITVDPATAMVELRAEFPNPQQLLLPGAFVRVRLEQGINERAVFVPQQAVMRNANNNIVLVVGPGNKVMPREVKLGPAKEDQWLVEDGLNVGDQVIVEGLQKAPPGSIVKPVPYIANSSAHTPISAPPPLPKK